MRLWLRTKPGNAIKKALDNSNHKSKIPRAKFRWKLAHIVLEVLYISLVAYFDIWESMLWEVSPALRATLTQIYADTALAQILWLVFALAWGTSHLFYARSFYGGDDAEVTSAENTWGFGQWVPVVLLILPVLSIGEGCYSEPSIHYLCMNIRSMLATCLS